MSSERDPLEIKIEDLEKSIKELREKINNPPDIQYCYFLEEMPQVKKVFKVERRP